MIHVTIPCGSEFAQPGAVAFLIATKRDDAKTEHLYLSDTPAHTNQSREPRLEGWCGTTNNVAKFARGVVRVERVRSNERADVTSLEGEELEQALLELGYSELAP